MPLNPVAQQLLQTALEIVDRDGSEALTIRALVRESGISNGSVYHHLGSLERVRELVAGAALEEWSDEFLTALRSHGYASAAESDGRWARQHPELAKLIETEAKNGRLGHNAKDFGTQLRQWLDDRQLAAGANAHLVAAVVIGPLIELRRQERAIGKRATGKDLAALEDAVTAALGALSTTTTNILQ
ncbi:TetR/AcrR family transcriptional regulator [Prescottella agglutinans]|uniref:TetR/AcrR family transcriptional regulator n=1 Tax=Prescottella agglutinans TaxID=1644129 RepID=A0A3S3BB51_9NOCA|nr:TetR/AcrR family transcriptional regulator [Prescottella agglutinans]RVW07270.1 TetR/AcrR family transcriptional regulator [Prescottella agglutinans]